MLSKNILKHYKSRRAIANAFKPQLYCNLNSSRAFSNKTILLNKIENDNDDSSELDKKSSEAKLVESFNSYSRSEGVSAELLENIQTDTQNLTKAKEGEKPLSPGESLTMSIFKSYQEELEESFNSASPEEVQAREEVKGRVLSSHVRSLIRSGNLEEAIARLTDYSLKDDYSANLLNLDYLDYIQAYIKRNNKEILKSRQSTREFQEFNNQPLLSGLQLWNIIREHNYIIEQLDINTDPLRAVYLQQVILHAFDGKIPEFIDVSLEEERLQSILKTVDRDGIVSLDHEGVFNAAHVISTEAFKILYHIPEFNKHLSDKMKETIEMDLEYFKDNEAFFAETGLPTDITNMRVENPEIYEKFVLDFMKEHAHRKKEGLEELLEDRVKSETLSALNQEVSVMQFSLQDKFEILKFFMVNKRSLLDDSWIEHFVSIDDYGVFNAYKCIPYENKNLRGKFNSLLESLNLKKQLAVEDICSRNGAKLLAMRNSNNRGFMSMSTKSIDVFTRWQLELATAVDKYKGLMTGKTEVESKKFELLHELTSETTAVVSILTLVKELTFYKSKSDLEDFKSDLSVGITAIAKSIGHALTFEFTRIKMGPDFYADYQRKRNPFFQQMFEIAISKNRPGFVPSAIKEQLEIDLGMTILDLILTSCTIKVRNVTNNEGIETAAFNRSYTSTGAGLKGVLTLHPVVVKKLSLTPPKFESAIHALPMLRSPKDWTDGTDGGYLSSRTLLLRVRNNNEQQYHLTKSFKENPHLSADILKGVNTLSKTGWTINENVFKVVLKMWNSGEAFLDIPGSNFIEITNPKSEKNPYYKKLIAKTTTPGETRNIMTLLRNLRQKLLSIRSTESYKMVLSKSYLGQRFYFPHTLDFRGRAYPINVYLNQLGNDISRGLLMFWDGKELGKKGLEWLMIHYGNTHGLSKKSFAQRVEFVKEHLSELEADVEDPHRADAFWKKAEDPLQCLATTYEIVNAYKCPDGPEKYVCHLPVHQDGSCNGLQHYAALGRDVSGAKAVNLLPSEVPQDVYASVAAVVNKKIYEEEEVKPEYKDLQTEIRGMLPTITRKICKQPVMTTVYGVTRFGARHQIAKQLNKEEAYSESRPKVMKHSQYITEKIFASLYDIFNSASTIQDWLGVCSSLIAKSVYIPGINQLKEKDLKLSSVSTIMWTTPLGLRVVHPYRNETSVTVSTSLQSVKFTKIKSTSTVNATKQSNAFPPNFIHSLDATHMLLTAVSCRDENIPFASVHDSYWSLPGDADKLGVLLRNNFVNMHKKDLVEVLKQELEMRYKNNVSLCKFHSNSPIADEIREYRYLFKKKYKHLPTLRDELTLESVRESLLNSPNVESQQKGAAMVTIFSILKSYTEEEIDRYAVPDNISVKSQAKSRFVRAYRPLKFPELPPKGDLNIEDVKKSLYFFS